MTYCDKSILKPYCEDKQCIKCSERKVCEHCWNKRGENKSFHLCVKCCYCGECPATSKKEEYKCICPPWFKHSRSIPCTPIQEVEQIAPQVLEKWKETLQEE